MPPTSQPTLPYFEGGAEFARAMNDMVRAIRRNRVTFEAPFEVRETPDGRNVRMPRRNGVVPFDLVVVLGSSVAEGPADYDTLTYAVELIESQLSLPELSSNPGNEIHRVNRIARYAEQIPDGQGGVTGWKVDPARPDTFGVAVRYPLYSAGVRVPGEFTTVIELFDERVHVKGCTS